MKRLMFFVCMLAMSSFAFAQNVSPSSDWKEIQPKEITINPINLYQDWIVLAVNNEEKPNAMLLTMGTMGVFRGKPIVSIFVNESRYTYELLQNPFFEQANLVIECRMLYTGTWDESKLDDSIKSAFYRDGVRRPAHQQFIAEIVHVWTK